MDIHIFDTLKEASKFAANNIIKKMIIDDTITLGLATGSSPIGIYKQLIEAYRANLISFKHTTTYNLDEYIGLPKDHKESYYSFMNRYLFSHVDIVPKNIHIPNTIHANHLELAHEYNQKLLNTTIDLQILGIGTNGHIGFNEPGTPLSNETFVTTLKQQTRNDNARFFPSLEDVPTHAITMGIKNIMRAKEIILIAAGSHKQDAVYKMVHGDITKDHPASVLQLHPNCTIVLDKNAAAKLKKRP